MEPTPHARLASRNRAHHLVEDGDTISIDIPNRRLTLEVTDDELAERRARLEAGRGYALTSS